MGKKMFWLILILIGISVIVFGIFYGKDRHENFVETTAVITRVEDVEEYDSDGALVHSHNYYCDFTVNGREYKDIEVPGVAAGYKEGKEITILYDPANPANIALPYSATAHTLFYVIGGLAVIAGLAGLVIGGRRS